MRRIIKSLFSIIVLVCIFLLGCTIGVAGDVPELVRKATEENGVVGNFGQSIVAMARNLCDQIRRLIEELQNTEDIVQIITEKTSQFLTYVIEIIKKFLEF